MVQLDIDHFPKTKKNRQSKPYFFNLEKETNTIQKEADMINNIRNLFKLERENKVIEHKVIKLVSNFIKWEKGKLRTYNRNYYRIFSKKQKERRREYEKDCCINISKE